MALDKAARGELSPGGGSPYVPLNTGIFTQVGASQIKFIDVADRYIDPGMYWLFQITDSATARFSCTTSAAVADDSGWAAGCRYVQNFYGANIIMFGTGGLTTTPMAVAGIQGLAA